MNRVKLPALLLCLVMAAGVLAGCKTDMDLVVGSVGGENVTVRDVTTYADYMLMNSGYSREDLTEEELAGLNENALDTAVHYLVVCRNASALGLYPLSEENRKAAEEKYSYLSSMGLAEDDARTLMTVFEVSDLLMAETTGDVAVTDGEVLARYNELLSAQQSSYYSNPAAYDEALAYGTEIVVYRPEGYRYVKHILIPMPEDIKAQITAAAYNGDTTAAATLREKGLEQIEDKAGEVLAKAQGGEDFDALIALYGADPGMQAEPAKTEGYQLGAESSYMPEFLEASMGLTAIGDTTGLVATDYGYHIIKYVGDVPAGAIALDEVRDGISAETLEGKRSDAYNALIEQWKAETTIKKNAGKIPS